MADGVSLKLGLAVMQWVRDEPQISSWCRPIAEQFLEALRPYRVMPYSGYLAQRVGGFCDVVFAFELRPNVKRVLGDYVLRAEDISVGIHTDGTMCLHILSLQFAATDHNISMIAAELGDVCKQFGELDMVLKDVGLV